LARQPKPLPSPSRKFSSQDHHWVIGSDEVGYGALAGPYCVAAVAVPEDWEWAALRDSKGFGAPKVAIPKRRAIMDAFVEFEPNPLTCFTLADSKQIDIIRNPHKLIGDMHVDVLKDVHRRLKQYVGSPPPAVELMADGDLELGHDIKSIIEGDTFVPAIMLASILAKDRRDALMIQFSQRYPGYGFERNMGYGSKEHYEGLEKLGPCPIHRRSYRLTKNSSSR